VNYRQVADHVGASPTAVSNAARRLGIPKPLTKDDADRIGFSIWGPHGGMPKFRQLDTGHFVKEEK